MKPTSDREGFLCQGLLGVLTYINKAPETPHQGTDKLVTFQFLVSGKNVHFLASPEKMRSAFINYIIESLFSMIQPIFERSKNSNIYTCLKYVSYLMRFSRNILMLFYVLHTRSLSHSQIGYNKFVFLPTSCSYQQASFYLTVLVYSSFASK